MAAQTLSASAKLVPLGIPLEVCFETHKENLHALWDLVSEYLGECGDIGTEKDDLFLLRFLLSSRGNVPAAARSLRASVEFRKGFLEEIRYVQRHGRTIDDESFSRFIAITWLEGLSDVEYPLLVIRAGKCNIKGLVNSWPAERIKRQMLMTAEVGFQKTNILTRKHQRLVKTINVIDLSGLSLSKMDKRYLDIQMEVNKEGMTRNPQLLGKTVMINLNFAFRILYKLLKPLLSRRNLEKHSFCPAAGTTKSTSDINRCPFVRRMNAVGKIPTILGGTLETPLQLQAAADRPNCITSHKVNGSSRVTLVEQEVISSPSIAHAELLVVSKGGLKVHITLDGEEIEEEFEITMDAGLVKKNYKLPSGGWLSIEAVNSSKAQRVVEVSLDIEHP